MMSGDDAGTLRTRLRGLGLSKPAIQAAWPTWWTDDANSSASARIELGFALARNLGLDPKSLLTPDQAPRFRWQTGARFKRLAVEGEQELEAITSFGRALASLCVAALPGSSNTGRPTARELRSLLLTPTTPFIRLVDLLVGSWGLGIPVIQLRVLPRNRKRMTAMTVRLGDRHAILLAKDSPFPAQSAFYLAHELGHIFRGHLAEQDLIVDLGESLPASSSDDDEEHEADAYGLEVLAGSPDFRILPNTTHYSAREVSVQVRGV
jgi:hypothetical protein